MDSEGVGDRGVLVLGLMSLHAGLRRMTHCLSAFLFHRVSELIPLDGLTVDVRRFRDFCALMRRSYRVVPLDEIFRGLRDGIAPAPRTVAITFDDSYADNLPAAEVLAEHGLPATFFVPTDYIRTDRVFPWDTHLPRLGHLTSAGVNPMIELGHDRRSHSASHAAWRSLLDETPGQHRPAPRRRSRIAPADPPPFAYPFGGLGHIRDEQLPWFTRPATTLHLGGARPRAGMRQILPRAAVPAAAPHLEVHITALGFRLCPDQRLHASTAKADLVPDRTQWRP